MIQFDEHVFQMGWFNHPLEKVVFWFREPIPPLFVFRQKIHELVKIHERSDLRSDNLWFRQVLQCTTQPNYCPDPSPLLELGARFGTTELEVSWVLSGFGKVRW